MDEHALRATLGAWREGNSSSYSYLYLLYKNNFAKKIKNDYLVLKQQLKVKIEAFV